MGWEFVELPVVCMAEEFFRPSATLCRIGLMESRLHHHCCHGGPPPYWLATPPQSCMWWCGQPYGVMSELVWRTPPLAGWPPLASWPPPYVMDGYGARPLRWLSVLVWGMSLAVDTRSLGALVIMFSVFRKSISERGNPLPARSLPPESQKLVWWWWFSEAKCELMIV